MSAKSHITGDTETTLRKILQTGPMRLLLAGMYFLLGVSRECVWVEAAPQAPAPIVGRSRRLSYERKRRLSRNSHRNTSHLRKFLPRGLTENQFKERCTRLSHMGRFQLYDFLYYRWEFWRIGAIAKRCRSTLPASGVAISLQPFGLSAAHLGPD